MRLLIVNTCFGAPMTFTSTSSDFDLGPWQGNATEKNRYVWWKDDERFFRNIILKTLWKTCEEDNIWIWNKTTCMNYELMSVSLKKCNLNHILFTHTFVFKLILACCVSPAHHRKPFLHGRFAAPHRSAITLWRSKRRFVDFPLKRQTCEVWCVSRRCYYT